jgi:tungstate transport system substrate-binding protein
MQSLSQAFKLIAQSRATFVSRGDDSGTHKKELDIWSQADVEPAGAWYKDVGLGMGRALQIADELEAYVLTDKGTWLALQQRLSLPIHVQSAPDGRNVYGVIAVNPQKHPQVNYPAAKKLIDWIQSAEAKSIITGHRVNGEQLFYIIE